MADKAAPHESSSDSTAGESTIREIVLDLAAFRAAGLEQLQLLQLVRFAQLSRGHSSSAVSALAQAQLLDVETRRAEAVAQLEPGKAGIQGRLTDDTGAPIAGAEVQVVDRADAALGTVTTDGGGYYSLLIPATKTTSVGIVVRVADKIVHREPAIKLGPDQLLHLDLPVGDGGR